MCDASKDTAVLVEVLENKSIKEKEVAAVIEEDGPTWMTQLVDYLKEGVLPGDKKEARKLRLKARQYELMKGVLYRRSFLTPWLRCVGPLQADYVMREIHEGSCSMHAGPRSVVAKAVRLGYYWPTMHKDARDMIRKCNDCQIHRPVTRHPQQPLTPITAPWPFYKWGIDIAGPFSEGPGKVKFLIVAMDYFTKWIEAKTVATITGRQVKKFVWDNIVCRFGIPGEIISDNGKQFSDNPFKDWCDKLNIAQRFASVKHPQSNGLVERANRSLRERIKARLGEGNKNWVEELPHVLWAHRTMIKSSHGDTPFSLTYRTEAVIPTEIGMPTYRTAAVDVVNNDEELRLNLDLLEERRERAAFREARAKSKMMKYYNARVRSEAFKPGDFVYRTRCGLRMEQFFQERGTSQISSDVTSKSVWARIPAMVRTPGRHQTGRDAQNQPQSRKRGRDGTDGNTPPKSLRKDHGYSRPTGSSHGGKSLAAIQLGLESTIFVPENAPAESRKRGRDGTDGNTPPKSLRRDHGYSRPTGSSHGGKSLAAIQLGLASTIFVPENAPAGVSDPDPLSFADPLSRHPADIP
nr:reverse transcriptase domain-containing protein [Tanacetum cinerariifolium]